MNTCNRVALAILAIELAGATTWAYAQLPPNTPQRRPGLWVAEITQTGRPTQTDKMCIDAATDPSFYKFGMGLEHSMCSKNEMRMEGDELVADSVCTMPKFFGHGGNTATTHGVTRYEGNTVYHTVVNTHWDPPLDGKAETITTVDGHWTGPCESGQKPGDVILSNGMTINIQDMGSSKSMLKDILKGLSSHN